MKILALDLGTKTGWATGCDGKLLAAGTLITAGAKTITANRKLRLDRRGDPRVKFLFDWLNGFREDFFDWIVFEDVQFSSSTMQTQLWSSFRAAVWLGAGRSKVECCPTGTLKKFATGHGGATKEMMAAALVRSDERFIFEKKLVKDTVSGISLTDDAVDAIHLLKWAMKTLKNTKP